MCIDAMKDFDGVTKQKGRVRRRAPPFSSPMAHLAFPIHFTANFTVLQN